MSAWMLPFITIALVGFGMFLIAEAWGGYDFEPATLGYGCAALMGALVLYRIWSRKH
ncbi:hypothetical protein [Pseudomonas azerbaijanoccidentalis]